MRGRWSIERRRLCALVGEEAAGLLVNVEDRLLARAGRRRTQGERWVSEGRTA